MTRLARLRVDFIACDGRGLCAEVLPELITLDDWRFPVVSGQDVPPRLLADARATVRVCPRLALRLDPGGRRPRPFGLITSAIPVADCPVGAGPSATWPT